MYKWWKSSERELNETAQLINGKTKIQSGIL